MTDESELVRGCRSSDPASLRAFLERFQGPIFGLCYRMLAHRQDAEDVAQEVFVRAWRALHQWDASRPLLPWLLTIAANRCRTELQQRRRLPVSRDVARDPETPGRAEASPADGLADELQRALAELREEYRVSFVLFHEQELSCAQIGEVLNCSENTVKTWLRRGRTELARRLRDRGFGVPEAAPATEKTVS